MLLSAQYENAPMLTVKALPGSSLKSLLLYQILNVTLCRSLISVCTVSSFSKEVKCGLCPDAPWRPPGLL